MTYDAERDAEEIIRPMMEWARHGFWLGLSGSGTGRAGDRFVPRSSAFHRIFWKGIGTPSTIDADEFRRRLDYGQSVQETLIGNEPSVIELRYRRLRLGRLIRLGIQVASLAAVVALAVNWSDWGALGLIVAAFVASAIWGLRIDAKDDELCAAALGSTSSETIRLPWMTAHSSGRC